MKGRVHTLKDPAVTTSAQTALQPISHSGQGGDLMCMFKLLFYVKGREKENPKLSFPLNRKRAKIGNYLLSDFS